MHPHTQTAAEQEKKQSQLEMEKLWGTPVKYGITIVQVLHCKLHTQTHTHTHTHTHTLTLTLTLIENKEGETPLDIAEEKKYDECLELVSVCGLLCVPLQSEPWI